MKKQAIGYVRVSTEQQAKEGASLEAQEKAINDWCDFKGYELHAIYIEPGISGKSINNRPRLQTALNALKKDMVFVTYSLSRISRNALDMLQIAEQIRIKQAHIVSFSEKENFDTTTVMGKFFFTLIAALNELERNQTSERTRLVKQYYKSNNRYNGGIIPYGYKLSKDKKTLIEDKEEMRLKKYIEYLAQQKFSLSEISRYLAEDGHFNRKNKPLHPRQISRILSF
jgi:site-specific DNA recombinase